MGKGTFIVVESTDEPERATQVTKLVERLKGEGYEVVAFDFPRYDEPSAYFAQEYRKGTYGSTSEVGPYTGSLFYALDRYQAAPTIREAVEAGKVVIASCFTGCNMADQGVTFAQSEHRRGFFIWLDNLEYEMLKIPRPDRSIVLRVPNQAAQPIIDVYDDLCQLFPKDFIRVDCSRGSKPLDVDTIHSLLWQTIEPLLPPKPENQSKAVVAKPATVVEPKEPAPTGKLEWGNLVIDTEASSYDTYYMPKNFDAKTKTAYVKTMGRIYEVYAEIAKKVPINTARLVLPVAATIQQNPDKPTTAHANIVIQKLAGQYLPENHASETEAVTLTSVWPRNELDLLPDMLYEYSNVSLKDLEDEVAAWPIARRMDIFEAYAGKRAGPALEKAHYSWDLVCDYSTFCTMQGYIKAEDTRWQLLTPRYGYEIPQAIEDADLVEVFEECFDLSLELYSTLQAAGFTTEAQYATLLGHKMRWKVTYNAIEVFQLQELLSSGKDHSNTGKLIQIMHERLAEVHPMIAEVIKPLNR